MPLDKDYLYNVIATGTLVECYDALCNFNNYGFNEGEIKELEIFFLPHLLVETKAYILTESSSQPKEAKHIKKEFVKFKKASLRIENTVIEKFTKQLDELWEMVDSGRNFEWHLYNFNGFDKGKKEYFAFGDTDIKNIVAVSQSCANKNLEHIHLVECKDELKYFWHYIYQGSIITNTNTLLCLAELLHFEDKGYEIEFKKENNFFILQQKSNFADNLVDKMNLSKKHDVLRNSCYRVCSHRLEANSCTFVFYDSSINDFRDNENMKPVLVDYATVTPKEGDSIPLLPRDAFKISLKCLLSNIEVVRLCNTENEKYEEYNVEDMKEIAVPDVNKTLSKIDRILNEIVETYITHEQEEGIAYCTFKVSIRLAEVFLTPLTETNINCEKSHFAYENEINISKSFKETFNEYKRLKHKMANFDGTGDQLHTLFIDQKEPILFVGEENFTFSAAFAAMRGSWNGIISTTPEKNLPTINDVKQKTLNALDQSKNDCDTYRTRIQNLSPSADWRTTINATRDLAQFKSQRNIWFQCPWGFDPENLLKNFVEHCSTFQQPGDLLIIGIVYKDPKGYYKKYNLSSFLGYNDDELDGFRRPNPENEKNSIIGEHSYELLGFDDKLIKKILSHGYLHHSNVTNIHNLILPYHKTIVLRKTLDVKDLTRPLEELNIHGNDDRQQNLVYKNARFVEEIDEELFSTQNFVITQNQTIEIKNLCKKYEKSITLLMFGNFGENPPNMPDTEPTAVFDVLVQQPVIIDKVMDHLPQTSLKAYLYLPNAPNGSEAEKIRFLSKLALEKECPLATTWALETFHDIAKLATDYKNILLFNTSVQLTKQFLTNINWYRNIFVSGNEELKNLLVSRVSNVDVTGDKYDTTK